MRSRRKPLEKVEGVLRLVVGAALLLMVIGTTVDAVGRYLFASSLPGMLRFTEWFLMPAVVFLSWGPAQRHRKHVAVDLLRHKLPGRAVEVLRRIADVLGLVLFGLVLWTTAEFAIDYWGRWTVESPSLPAGPSRAILVAGAAFMVLRLAVQVVKGDDAPTDTGTPADATRAAPDEATAAVPGRSDKE